MPSLSADRVASLLSPYLQAYTTAPPPALSDQLGLYLDLLLKWNARTNLTAIRDPETIVTRHFGESLFLACHLPPGTETVLDLGSGAGLPGIPLHLLRPDLSVTLAESQGKKAAFLREVIRSLQLTTQVHAGRAEDLVGKQRFSVVALRAVDNMQQALHLAATLAPTVLALTTERTGPGTASQFRLPGTDTGVLAIYRSDSLDVPRGT